MNIMGKNWISGAIKRPGQLHRDLGVPQGRKLTEADIEQGEASRNPKTRARARLAETMRSFRRTGRR